MRACSLVALVPALATLIGCGGSSQSPSDGVAGNPTTPSAIPAASAASLAFSTTASRGWASIDVSVDGRYVGSLSRYFPPGAASASCTAVTDTRVVTAVSAGSHSYSARTNNGGTWTGTTTLSSGGCREVVLTCTNDDCSR
jgi:hypothetical protein